MSRLRMGGWILPSLAYAVLLGGLGVTVRFALRGLAWQQLVLWTAVAYIVVALVLVATGIRPHFPDGLVGGMTVVSAFISPLSVCALYLALGRGQVSRVTPLTTSYPFITLVLSVAVLTEALSWKAVVGSVLIVGGAVVISL